MEEFIKNVLFDPVIGRLVAIFLGAIIIWTIIKVTKLRLVSRIKDNDNRYRTRKFLDFFGYILIIVLIMVIYSSKLGGLTVALGVAGAGIAFALQEVIASFAGWLAILFGGFFKTGDRVQLGGIRGDVIDIGVLRTTLMETGQWIDGDLYNGRIVLIANSFVFKEPVFNYSRDFPFLWDEIKVPVMFGSNYRKAMEILQEVVAEYVKSYTDFAGKEWEVMVDKYMIENARTEPMVTLVANDNWVEYTVRYVVDYKKRRITKNDLFLKILDAFEATDGEIKFASATFQLVEPPEIKVKISD